MTTKASTTCSNAVSALRVDRTVFPSNTGRDAEQETAPPLASTGSVLGLESATGSGWIRDGGGPPDAPRRRSTCAPAGLQTRRRRLAGGAARVLRWRPASSPDATMKPVVSSYDIDTK